MATTECYVSSIASPDCGVYRGILPVVQLLASEYDLQVAAGQHHLLDIAAFSGLLDMFVYLWGVVGPRGMSSFAAEWSVENGHLTMVQYLVQNSLAVFDVRAVQVAAHWGHTELLYFLLDLLISVKFDVVDGSTQATMTAAVESKLGLLGLGLAQIAIAYGSVMFYPRYFGPLETNHPTGLAQSVLMVAALTFPLLAVTAPGKTFMSGFQTIALGLVASIVGTLAIHVVIIFFGAPLFQLRWETLLLAALVSILSIPALIMHLPMNDESKYLDW
ncbi:hypothetical protein Ae201684P_018804 [Aphanomyces euteiches]|nr:hypothetical protein Ae201684P_018804 [Aphanomyces euteiches]